MKFHGENNVHELGDDVDLERAQRTRKLELHVSFEVKFWGFLDPVMTCGGDVDDPTPCLNETRWNEREQAISVLANDSQFQNGMIFLYSVIR